MDIDMDIPISSKAAVEDDQAHTFEFLREFMYQEAAAADQIYQEWLDNLMDEMDERHIEEDDDDIRRTEDFDSESSDSEDEDSTLEDDGDKDVDIPFSKSCKQALINHWVLKLFTKLDHVDIWIHFIHLIEGMTREKQQYYGGIY